jgi:hypothetical protein
MVYRASEKVSPVRITDCDIVLISCEELRNSLPFPDKEAMDEIRALNKLECGKLEDDESTPIEKWIDEHLDEGGELYRIVWHRVSNFVTQQTIRANIMMI